MRTGQNRPTRVEWVVLPGGMIADTLLVRMRCGHTRYARAPFRPLVPTLIVCAGCAECRRIEP